MKSIFKGALCALLGLMCVTGAMAQRRMIPHVTSPTGGFTTQVILTNPTGSDQSYTIAAYDITGRQLGVFTGIASANSVMESSANEFFGTTAVSHFQINEDSKVNVSVAYQSVSGGSPAHLNESSKQATTWSLFPGDWSTVIDGVAVINTGSDATDIVVRQLAHSGALISEKVVVSDLAPFEKGLFLLDEDFTAQPQTYFEISGGSSELAVVAIRFERSSSSFMWQNLSLEFETPAQEEGFQLSVVVEWNEALLAAVRNGSPRPTVTTRSLYMVHRAIYDAWSLYDDFAVPTLLDANLRRPIEERTRAMKTKAINQAAYHTAIHVFSAYEQSTGVFSRLMADLGDTIINTPDTVTPSGLGLSAAQAAIDAGAMDGSNSANNFAQITTEMYPQLYSPANSDDPSAANSAGNSGFDMNHWVPLRVPNGNTKDADGNAILDHNDPSSYSTQGFLTPHWGSVEPFALTSGDQFRPPAPPQAGSEEPYTDALGNEMTNDAAYNQQVDEVLNVSATLTDTQKVIAEYWADGPRSETPPGHWNAIAHGIAKRDHHTLDDDVKMFFALNGAVYDAGISSWDAKRVYDYIRPVSAIRHKYAGQMIQGWGGPNRGTTTFPAEEWLPYQALTFVTPPFAEFVSGHSTFSRAAAEVLTLFTGSNQFYDGVTRLDEDFNSDGIKDLLGQHIIGVGGNMFEATPSSVITLKWPTFQDASDEAGRSRIYGGIHFQDGDHRGRYMGSQIGPQAFEKAASYWNGTINK